MTKIEEKFHGSYYVGQEYVEDKNRTSIHFDVQFYSPAELLPFDFFYKKRRITGSQKGRYLNVSFVEKLPRKLIDDIARNRKNAQSYVYGYITTPLTRVNQEMLRQRYALGHFLVNTFSFFDISSITLTNIDETPTDEIITIPWPPIISAPPHSHFTKTEKNSEPNTEGKYLLLKRNTEKYQTVQGLWDIVGGRIEPGTALIENLKREVKEETQLEIVSEPKLIFAQDIIRAPERHVVRLTYTADVRGEVVLDTTENCEYRWLSLSEIQAETDLDVYVKEIIGKNILS